MRASFQTLFKKIPITERKSWKVVLVWCAQHWLYTKTVRKKIIKWIEGVHFLFCVSNLDRPSVVTVARSFKKSFTKLALKLSYQKTLLLRKKLCFRGKNFAPARPTSPLLCDQLRALPDQLCPCGTTRDQLCLYFLYIKYIHWWIYFEYSNSASKLRL
jgi:hypothetical protein